MRQSALRRSGGSAWRFLLLMILAAACAAAASAQTFTFTDCSGKVTAVITVTSDITSLPPIVAGAATTYTYGFAGTYSLTINGVTQTTNGFGTAAVAFSNFDNIPLTTFSIRSTSLEIVNGQPVQVNAWSVTLGGSGTVLTPGPFPTTLPPLSAWTIPALGSQSMSSDYISTDLSTPAYYICGSATGTGGTCSYKLGSEGQAFPASGGSGTINITAPPGCNWSIIGAPGWMVFTGASSGSGNGTVAYTILPNAGADRTASLSIAGLGFDLEQISTSLTGASASGTLAQVVSEGTWAMTLAALNLGTSPGEVRMNFTTDRGVPMVLPLGFPQEQATVRVGPAPAVGRTVDPQVQSPQISGTLLASALDRTLAPGAQLVMETNPDSSSTTQGWAQLIATAGVTGFGIFSNPTLKWEAVVPLESRNAGSYVLAFDNTGSIGTGLAIANLTNVAANVPVIFRDDTGAQIGTQMIPLGALAHTSFLLAGQYAVTANKRGTVEFDTPTGGQISVLGLRANQITANTSALTTLPVLANVGTSGGIISQIAYNGGFTTFITLVNTGSSTASVTLNLFGDDGSPLATPFLLPQTGGMATGPTITQNLAPGASLILQTQADDNATNVQGWAQLTTNGNVSGFGIFRWTTFGQEASVPLEIRNPTSFVLPFDDTAGTTSGLAIANVSNQTANITLNIDDDTGTLQQTTSITLQANQHTSFMLPDKYASAVNKRGTVEFVTPMGGRISVIGLRATSAGTLTTIPVLAK